jgi:hypothetical protein
MFGDVNGTKLYKFICLVTSTAPNCKKPYVWRRQRPQTVKNHMFGDVNGAKLYKFICLVTKLHLITSTTAHKLHKRIGSMLQKEPV